MDEDYSIIMWLADHAEDIKKRADNGDRICQQIIDAWKRSGDESVNSMAAWDECKQALQIYAVDLVDEAFED